ncbi:MarR family transcriptional regulator [Peptococcaceae bacterium 1198_IL3148]
MKDSIGKRRRKPAYGANKKASNKNISILFKNYPCKDEPLLSQSWRLYMYLRRLFHNLDVAFEKDLSGLDLTPAQFIALLTIIFEEGLSMSNLAELCHWNRSTASRITHSLNKKQLITIAAMDGKTSALKATAKGQSLAAHYITKDLAEFKHGLIFISDEAQASTDVYDWLKTSVKYLIGEDIVNYIEDTCKKVNDATLT